MERQGKAGRGGCGMMRQTGGSVRSGTLRYVVAVLARFVVESPGGCGSLWCGVVCTG